MRRTVPFLTINDRISKFKQLMAEFTEAHLAELRSLVNVSFQNYPELLDAVIETKNEHGSTILMVAAHLGWVTIVSSILNAAKDRPDFLDIVNTKNKTGETLLILAAARGHISVIETVLNALEDSPESLRQLILEENDSGQTACMWANHRDYTEISTLLRPWIRLPNWDATSLPQRYSIWTEISKLSDSIAPETWLAPSPTH